jgi:hypothetical protein
MGYLAPYISRPTFVVQNVHGEPISGVDVFANVSSYEWSGRTDQYGTWDLTSDLPPAGIPLTVTFRDDQKQFMPTTFEIPTPLTRGTFLVTLEMTGGGGSGEIVPITEDDIRRHLLPHAEGAQSEPVTLEKKDASGLLVPLLIVGGIYLATR